MPRRTHIQRTSPEILIVQCKLIGHPISAREKRMLDKYPPLDQEEILKRYLRHHGARPNTGFTLADAVNQ